MGSYIEFDVLTRQFRSGQNKNGTRMNADFRGLLRAQLLSSPGLSVGCRLFTRLKADFLPRLLRGHHELADRLEYGLYLLVVLSKSRFQLFQLAGQLLMGSDILRNWTKARMIATFTSMARSLWSTEESMATPCSVKA
jgi:hypothetical protein